MCEERPTIQIGFRVGKLTVESQTEERKNGYIIWRCRCDCGGTILLDTRCLQRGTVQDCGCSTVVKPGQRDITGLRFGMLVAIAPTGESKKDVGTIWHCRCDCGGEIDAPLRQLTSGYRKSCGCLSHPRRKDYVGRQFGLLTVLKYAGKRNGQHRWNCICRCGNTIEVGQTRLQAGKTISCGCVSRGEYGISLQKNAPNAGVVGGNTVSKRRKQQNIAGLRSGKVTAIAPTNTKRRGLFLWRCRCDCGTEFLVEPYKIVNHKIQSCGCARKGHNLKDLAGRRFGKLTVLRRLDEKIGSSYAWLCQCDCGKTLKVSTNALLSTPGTRSCGCGRVEAVMKTLDTYGTVSEHCHFVDGTCVEKILPQKPQRNNTSGYTGVQVRGNRYIAIITFKRKVYYLGSYTKIEDAVTVRRQAEAHLFGTFLDWYYTEYPSVKNDMQKHENTALCHAEACNVMAEKEQRGPHN